MLLPPPARPHRVAVLAFDGMAPFELGCVVELFGLPRPELDLPWYDLTVCAETLQPLRVVGGFTMTAGHGLDALATADTVIVPGVADVRGPVSAALVRALREAYERGARMVSICSGAFALAAAGLLDGRPATTHWRYATLLQERFPAVRVNPSVLYVDDGDVLTSAGSAAGLDLLIHLVRRDHGPGVANTVARRLVVPPHREGGQAQFIQAAVTPVEDDDAVARAMAWAMDHLATPITVAELASVAHMSERTFIRRFKLRTGTSPLRWVISQRVAASLPLLESTAAPVEEIGAAVGFESPVTFRHHFTRAMRTSPSAYRKAFSP
ncbi:Transcriptional regulator containing an amidase domain and an AraC-type DNA-binding HTH domain [[Actinomadura] parvosata subsp. kistnae]|uniref:AraC family transcriptional regulator n=1 Tax=[Actinomadura] parvosata subsp. kistnae TaxID=1909395 RepID=A0A1V0AHW5_9ACTN|nr:helix-turn-helix domain-containing protein [Nonomuraea sp. ATCC 55076]AQZ69821.1 AraC family transcriptional regulator [Nonomuraea sp. ATCC 55076]SPL90115.1 Transcriptional regulator containing an amidase domain and an AraC-type DNA-binding HTH domain [Actinomadura parvosata subsp. kistnae]